MKTGAASGAITLGLAIVLVMMSQAPDASRAKPPAPKPPLEKPAQAAPPSVAAVRLPPPPAPKPRPSSIEPAPRVKSLQPSPPDIVKPAPKVAPLKPRRATKQQTSAPPAEAKPSPRPERAAAQNNAKAAREGRALLRMLEAGKGPVIEIAWPSSASDRDRLYALFTQCYGMQTAVMAAKGTMYSATGRPGETWEINRDAVSGFVRQPSGALTSAEQNTVATVSRRHGLRNAAPVRLFPRAVDAALLGGLRLVVGSDYTAHKIIRARYVLAGGRISIAGIRTDGVTQPGTVTLPARGRCS